MVAGDSAAARAPLGPWTWVVSLAYYVALEGLWGASLGKRLMGLRVMAADGTRASWARIVRRAATFYVPNLLLALPIPIAGAAGINAFLNTDPNLAIAGAALTLALVFSLRSPVSAAWHAPRNGYLAGSVVLSAAIVMAALYLPALNEPLGTVALGPTELAGATALALVPFACVELGKAVPEVEPGIHLVERQFGVLEVHSRDPDDVARAGEAILRGINARAEDGLRPRVLYTDVIEDVTDQHAVILNRNREASMLLPGQTLLVVEMVPALFAAFAANAAERAAPEVTLVTVSMIGAAGRVYLAGATADIVRAAPSPLVGRASGETQ